MVQSTITDVAVLNWLTFCVVVLVVFNTVEVCLILFSIYKDRKVRRFK